MNQCTSCGGFCKKSGCERDNTQPDDLADLLASIKGKQQRIGELESQMQGLSNEINDFQNIVERQKREIDLLQKQLYELKAQEPVAFMKRELRYHDYEGSAKQDDVGYLVNMFYGATESQPEGCTPLYSRPVPFSTTCTSDEWLANATQSTRDLANKIKGSTVTSASVIAGLEMALSQAAAMIERQQHVMQRAMEAWDTTTHKKNGDGRLWQCMEELRSESDNAIHPA